MFGKNLFGKGGPRFRKSAAGLAIELVVVFVGVYLAFLASDYQEELRDRDVRIKYYEALILEFETLARHLEEEHEKIRRHLAVIGEIEAANQALHGVVVTGAIPDLRADRDRLLAQRFHWPF